TGTAPGGEQVRQRQPGEGKGLVLHERGKAARDQRIDGERRCLMIDKVLEAVEKAKVAQMPDIAPDSPGKCLDRRLRHRQLEEGRRPQQRLPASPAWSRSSSMARACRNDRTSSSPGSSPPAR